MRSVFSVFLPSRLARLRDPWYALSSRETGEKRMGTFRVELKKTVDDSYEIEVGRALAGRLVKDLEGGLMGGLGV